MKKLLKKKQYCFKCKEEREVNVECNKCGNTIMPRLLNVDETNAKNLKTYKKEITKLVNNLKKYSVENYMTDMELWFDRIGEIRKYFRDEYKKDDIPSLAKVLPKSKIKRDIRRIQNVYDKWFKAELRLIEELMKKAM